jgi:hypothetical protein
MPDLDPADMFWKGGELDIWLAAVFAPKWFDDAAHEAASVGPDARRREIVFAVCFAESYLLEWVRRDVLKDLRRLDDYFPPGDRRSVTDRWKEVPKQLHQDGLTRGHPDYGQRFWADFMRLVDYRHGLVHGRASRPDKDDLPEKAKPVPAPGDLDAMPQGRGALRVAVAPLPPARDNRAGPRATSAGR